MKSTDERAGPPREVETPEGKRISVHLTILFGAASKACRGPTRRLWQREADERGSSGTPMT